jgi:hypothetical protein
MPRLPRDPTEIVISHAHSLLFLSDSPHLTSPHLTLFPQTDDVIFVPFYVIHFAENNKVKSPKWSRTKRDA